MTSPGNVTRRSFQLQPGAIGADGQALRLVTATGFFVKHLGTYYLMTNWHVVMNRVPNTARVESISKHPVVPTVLRLVLPVKDEPRQEVHEIDLLTTGWRSLGPTCDVVAIPVQLPQWCDEIPTYEHMLVPREPAPTFSTSDDLFIVGYPYGISTGNRTLTAMWTRATVASYDHDLEAQAFFVDARTRQGNSGSPAIIYRNSGTLRYCDGSIRQVIRPVVRLAGIYSGRLGGDLDIGRVWPLKAIENTISHGSLCFPDPDFGVERKPISTPGDDLNGHVSG